VIERFKKKAYAGLAVWAISVVALVGLLFWHPGHPDAADQFLRNLKLVFILADMTVMMITFFWAAHHFAVAKGHSPGIIFFGILGPIAQIGVVVALFVLADRCAPHTLMHRKKPSVD